MRQGDKLSSRDLPALGIVGGTFDPIHFGHLNPVKEAVKQLGLKTVYFVPAAISPHKTKPVAESHHRLAMVKLALKDYPEFKPDDRELRRAGHSYTIDTLKSFRKEFGENIPIMMFVGADAFNEFNSWHQWQSIPDLAHIIVVTRPGFPITKLSTLTAAVSEKTPNWQQCKNIDQLYKQANGLVFFQSVEPVNVSATKIRTSLAVGNNDNVTLSQELPAAVYDYINEHHLYTSKTPETECNHRN